MLKFEFTNTLKYIEFKFIILFISLTLISFNVNGQSKISSLDSSLSKNILSSLNHKAGEKLMIYTDVTEDNILWIKKNKPEPLWGNIKKLYNCSDDNIVSHLIPKKTTGKFLFDEKSKDINLKIGRISDNEYLNLRSFQTIVDFFLILYNQTGDKCLISYHLLNNGEHFIFLKKYKGIWLIEFKYETLE
jgi:hypothetical protein